MGFLVQPRRPIPVLGNSNTSRKSGVSGVCSVLSGPFGKKKRKKRKTKQNKKRRGREREREKEKGPFVNARYDSERKTMYPAVGINVNGFGF